MDPMELALAEIHETETEPNVGPAAIPNETEELETNQEPEPNVGLTANPGEIEQSTENQQQEPAAESVGSVSARHNKFHLYVPLHNAALKGDWKTAEDLLKGDPNLVRTPLTEGGLTVLHIAAAEGHAHFVKKLLRNINDDADIGIENEKGLTALYFAAAVGYVDIAQAIVARNHLPTTRGERGPLYKAVQQGHKNMARYLLNASEFESWEDRDQIKILTTSIDSGLYDIALEIVPKINTLDAVTPLRALAKKPFCGANQQGFWGSIPGKVLCCMKPKTHDTSAHRLFDCLWCRLIGQEDVETNQLDERISELLFSAAESGNDEFLVELIKKYPDSIYNVNTSKHSIFHIAVSKRYVKEFNLIYELRGIKALLMQCIDNDDNNILHLAADLAPQHRLDSIQGAALQMQWEVLWYKNVEKIVPPSFNAMKNRDGKTPYELFLEEHEKLKGKGEKEMKQIAKSCMLVTILIATVIFAAAFTVPGDYDKGVPVLRNKKLFILFPICEALATVGSLISLVMFLSILVSRYSTDDFLRTLPRKLVGGVIALLASVLAMMGALYSCLMFYNLGRRFEIVLLCSFASVPIIFLMLMCPLLVTIIGFICSSICLFKSDNRLF